jgi:hypothetical protein
VRAQGPHHGPTDTPNDVGTRIRVAWLFPRVLGTGPTGVDHDQVMKLFQRRSVVATGGGMSSELKPTVWFPCTLSLFIRYTTSNLPGTSRMGFSRQFGRSASPDRRLDSLPLAYGVFDILLLFSVSGIHKTYFALKIISR